MTHALKAYRNQDEDGFTLIELLVVVIIIGILAAIAIPAFLNQRERAWQSEVTSTVRNVALEVEAEATQAGGIYLNTPATADGAFTGADAATARTALQDFVDARLLDLQGAADTPVDIVATGGNTASFQICGFHQQILTQGQVHRVVYDSDGADTAAAGVFPADTNTGISGQGVQDYDETADCTNTAAP